MKRLIVLAAAALMAFPAMAQMQEAYPSYIQVNGRAEKEITPDEFYLQVVINERDSKGRISVESQQRDMIAALRKLGVDVEKQLKVANLSSEFFKKNTSWPRPSTSCSWAPRPRWRKSGRRSTPWGFRTSRS